MATQCQKNKKTERAGPNQYQPMGKNSRGGKAMKQFIRILEEYYATDGILRVYCEKIDPKDIIPEMVENAVRCMESIEEESNGKIHSITLQGLQQYSLIITHMAEEIDIMVPVKETAGDRSPS